MGGTLTPLQQVNDVEVIEGPATAQDYADLIRAEWRKSIEGIVGAGRWLIAAKNDLDYGEFGRMFRNHPNPVERPVSFVDRTGRRLMAIANHPALPDRTYTSDLPASWMTLAILARLTEGELTRAIETSEVNPDMKQGDATKVVEEALRRRLPGASSVEVPIKTTPEYLERPGLIIRHGDFREVLADIPRGSVDLVITDPPYDDDSLPLFGDLAKWASRVLRPGGVAAIYTGAFRLPQVLELLTANGLTYRWMFCLDQQAGSQDRFTWINVFQRWKPIIICSHEQWTSPPWGPDVLISPGREKDTHAWQQSLAPVAELIARYSEEGWVIADPFLGGGTTAIAALQGGRKFIGAEFHDESFRTARDRILAVLS